MEKETNIKAEVKAEVKEEAKTQAQYDSELAKKKLELAELEILEKRANLEDLKDRLAERNMRRELVSQRAKTNGDTLRDSARRRVLIQQRCNHKKGGNGADGIVGGQGDDSQYAVLKHKMANNDIWVRCLRCGKWWVPPCQEDYETETGYRGAVAEYTQAVSFTTRNVMSSSIAMQWGDGGKYYRDQMKNTVNT